LRESQRKSNGIKKMTREEFNKLITDHAKAWCRVGSSAPHLVFNPYHQKYIKDGIEATQKLMDTFDEIMNRG
jgi:hypothetical protein